MPPTGTELYRRGWATLVASWAAYARGADAAWCTGCPAWTSPSFRGIPIHGARDRGCETASLQSTPMAQRLYAALGFRDPGRFLEYAPPSR